MEGVRPGRVLASIRIALKVLMLKKMSILA